MLETLKKKKRFSLRNKYSRKHPGRQSHKQSRIGGGVSKKYKSPQGKYTQRIRKITPARYDDTGKLIGGGIFDYFKLKMNVRKIKNIIGKLNVLERHIKKEIDSYEVQANQFKSMADKTAQYQTEYIIAKRRNVILKNYRKDAEEINQKTDKNVMAGIDSEIKRSDSDYKHADKMVAAQYKEAGKDIKNFLYLSVKYQKELKKFEQIDELRKKVEIYQNEIAHIRDKAQAGEGRSDLGKAEKAAIAKYRANKADYDYVVSLTDQDLQTVRELQQRSSKLTTTMEFYKNQFGMYKREGYESKGAQGAIKVGSTLKQWADLTDKLAASLLGVYGNAKGIIATLEEVKTGITKCRTILITVPEYNNKDANANAILWFEHDVEDMIKVVEELKKHFGNMKNEFYNQIAAENMYSNYNYNSKFLRVIEIRLKFYEWMMAKAFTKDDLHKREDKPVSGGYYNLIGGLRKTGTRRTRGSRAPAATGQAPASPGTTAPAPGRRTQRVPGNAGACVNLTDFKPFAEIELNCLAKSLMNITKGLNKPNNDCYNLLNKDDFTICIKNKFNRYLLASFLEDDILDTGVLNGANTVIRENITKFINILNLLASTSTWDPATKQQVANEFTGFMPHVQLVKSITDIAKSNNTLTIADLFDNTGNQITGITYPPEAQVLQDYLASKTHLKEFLGQLVSHKKDFYGVLEYDKTQGKVINNHIASLPAAAPAAAPAATPAGTTSPGTTPAAAPAPGTTLTPEAPGAQAAPPAPTTPATPPTRFNDKLNSDELQKIKDIINSIKNGLDKFGIYPSNNFNTMVDLLYTIAKSIEDIYDSLPRDNPVDIQIKGLDTYKEYIHNTKTMVDADDVNKDIDDDDNIKDMIDKLEEFNADYQFMNTFYDFMKREKTKAKEALQELIEQYTKDTNNKETIGKIAKKIGDKPEYSKKANTTLQLPTTTASTMASTTASTTASTPTPNPPSNPLLAPAPAATNPISNAKTKELKALDKVPDWLNDLDTRSRNNKDYISNILVRIPDAYPKQYKDVKEQFKEMQDKLQGLIGAGNTLAKLSDDFQTMTTTLIDIKSIESDLIDVKVRAEPKHFLGLGSYIPEPLSMEKKSQAREDTKKISELVKGMMQNTFFEDRGDKEKAIGNGASVFDRIIPLLSKDRDPNISYEDQSKLRNPDALDAFLEKLKKYIKNAGISSAIVAGQALPTQEIKESQMKLCRLVHKLENIVTDAPEVEKIKEVSKTIGDCSSNGSILGKQGKPGKKGQQGQQQSQSK